MEPAEYLFCEQLNTLKEKAALLGLEAVICCALLRVFSKISLIG
jgi:hypothetical protein